MRYRKITDRRTGDTRVWNRSLASRGTAVVLALFTLTVLPGTLSPQESGAARRRIEAGVVAPPIPARLQELDLFVREAEGGRGTVEPIRILRYGHRGSLEYPGALDIPGVGRAFVLHTYDLVAPRSRAVEVRRLPEYRGWLQFAPGAYAIPLGQKRFELAVGVVYWRTGDDDTRDLVVSAGPVAVRGRGELRIERSGANGATLDLVVERGRFEVLRGGDLETVIAAGQSRRFSLDDRSVPATAFAGRRSDLERLLAELAITLHDGTPSGEVLLQLWELVRDLVPRFALGEINASPGVDRPDLFLRSLGEALRLLAAYSFVVPEAGM